MLVLIVLGLVGCKALLPPAPAGDVKEDSNDVKEIEEEIEDIDIEELDEELGLDELDDLDADLDALI